MNKTFQKTIAGILLTGVLATGSAVAEYNHDGTVNVQGDIMTISAPIEVEATENGAFQPMTKPIYRINSNLYSNTYN